VSQLSIANTFLGTSKANFSNGIDPIFTFLNTKTYKILNFSGFCVLEAFPGGRGLLQESDRNEMLVLGGRGRHWLRWEIVGGPRQAFANGGHDTAGALPYDLSSFT